MIYRLFLILFVIYFIDPRPALAENERYRVEILVLTHLGHGQQGTEVVKPEDFSSALDFLKPPEEEESEPVAEADAEETAEVEPDFLVDEEAPVEVDPAEHEAELLNAVVHVEEMGPEMQEGDHLFDVFEDEGAGVGNRRRDAADGRVVRSDVPIGERWARKARQPECTHPRQGDLEARAGADCAYHSRGRRAVRGGPATGVGL